MDVSFNNERQVSDLGGKHLYDWGAVYEPSTVGSNIEFCESTGVNINYTHYSTMSGNQFSCDCGESFNSQAELDEHNRQQHDADAFLTTLRPSDIIQPFSS